MKIDERNCILAVLFCEATAALHHPSRAGPLAAVLVLSACGGSGGTTVGGGGGGGNPPSDAIYSVIVTATSGNLVRVSTLTVTVQ